jgi:protein tyrosine phosphatase (PTP) superfamily phosphohydrolase (DUF442 family)
MAATFGKRIMLAGGTVAVAAMTLPGCAQREAASPSATATQEGPRPGTLGYDMNVWHSLLEENAKLHRVVTHLDNGIEATTESDDPAVVAKLVDHATAMQRRIEKGSRVRVWDPVFRELFENHQNVKLEVTVLEKGVRIVETTSDPATLDLMRAHAMGVSEFVREGFETSGRETPRFVATGSLPLKELAIGGVPHRFVLGQPDAAQLAGLKNAGVTGVLNFRKEAELKGFDEKAAAGQHGMEYCSIPYNGAKELTDELFDAGRDVLKKAKEQKQVIALHCRSGNRIGPVWAAYRVLDDGVGIEQAIAEAKAMQMADPAYEARAREYVAARAAK